MKYLLLIVVSCAVQADIPAGLILSVITTANQPVAFVSAHDGSGDMFIVERPGVIKRFSEGKQSMFLDISEKVEDTFSDQGLLGVVFDPHYAENGIFYVNYTAAGGQYGFGRTIIERYRYDDELSPVVVDSPEVILIVDQFYHNHNGGSMFFGQDGYLYIATGDGGMRRDPQNFALNISELLGKMLRIDVNPDILFKSSWEYDNRCGLVVNYYLVNDNSYTGDEQACGEVFFFGLRSPWKWSFDRLTGDFFIGDVGQDREEEISYVAATSLGGENLGWSCKEGDTVIVPERCPDDMTELTDPIISYLHNPDNSGNAVLGGYRYRGKEIPELYGQYIYADTISGQIWFAEFDGKQWLSTEWHQSEFLLVSFAEDHEGNLYTVNFTGAISKFVMQ